jgi:hypothetical protein
MTQDEIGQSLVAAFAQVLASATTPGSSLAVVARAASHRCTAAGAYDEAAHTHV